MHVNKPIKVLIIDHSVVTRYLLKEILEQAGDISVVGAIHSPSFALGSVINLSPDVVIVDIGSHPAESLAFIEKLVEVRPLPVIMLSSPGNGNGAALLKALESGAVDCIQKQSTKSWSGMLNMTEEILQKVREAAGTKPQPDGDSRVQMRDAAKRNLIPSQSHHSLADRLIVIGAAAGGVHAVKSLLASLPATVPGIVVAQHLPATITETYADRLNSLCDLTVKEARTGDRIEPGTAFIAPDIGNLKIRRNGQNYYTDLENISGSESATPSADALFSSVARCAGPNAIGIILSGSGRDGAKGLLEMKNRGALTIVQEPAAAHVSGMARNAISAGAAEIVAPLTDIANIILKNI